MDPPPPPSPKIIANRKKAVRSRAGLKGKITTQLALMNADPSDNNIANCKMLIGKILPKIEELDSVIIDSYSEEFADDESIPDSLSIEIDKQTEYITEIHNKLSLFNSTAVVPDKPKSSSNCKLKLPDLKCDSFTGEGTSQLQFHSFLSQFNNIVGFRSEISDSVKLTYLRNYLKGYALKLVEHLQITDLNYNVCIDLLKSEFLNETILVDDLLKKLLDLKPKFDTTFHETKVFLSEVRCLISDLKIYDFDYMEEKSGSRLVSHIIFNKLPSAFQQEIVRKLNSNFPSLKQILDNYVDVICTLNLRPNKNIKSDNSNASESVHQARIVSRSATLSKNNGREVVRLCKFCTSTGHNMIQCDRYVGYEARKKRCLELKMCIKCSSQKHKAPDCNRPLDFPCYKCNSRHHISALCDKAAASLSANFCLNSSYDSGRGFLLPMINLKLSVGNSHYSVRCLIDTGSQRSYLSSKVVKNLEVCLDNKTKLSVSTFINSDYMEFCETAVSVELDGGKFVIPFLINDSFDLSLDIAGLEQCHTNIAKSFILQDRLYSDKVVLEGLIGVDVLQCLRQLEVVSCLNGTAFQLTSGIVPFGNVDNFLSRKQLQSKYSYVHSDNQDSLTSVERAVVNCALNPVKTSFDPIGSVIDESSVDERLDKMFSLDSMGLSEESCDYDASKIAEFEAKIEFKEGSYYVDLPWNSKISSVPNNYNVALAILNRVLEFLGRNNLYERYDAVFKQQLTDNILEEIQIDDLILSDHVFVPHRPVVRTESNVTTKVRPVLNCSLKLGNAPSLNEAAYPGIDLVNNLLQLLIKVRSDKYLVLSDIKAAFLMIKLNLDSDRNKFTILWRCNGKLVAYRYTTIVFGFITSPFILQCVIRYHLRRYANDKCCEVLRSGMYVDNLFFTGNNPDYLLSMYRDCSSRMLEGGFTLRSWASNSPELSESVKLDSLEASTDNDWEKLLGYKYFPESDKIMINDFDKIADITVTKRYVLSYVSRIFDPLGLVLPITVRTKLFIQTLWQRKLGWDELIPVELLNIWIKLKADLDLIPAYSFDRFGYSGELSLFICCDSSRAMYGFCCYVKGVSSTAFVNLILAKSRVAPTKSKSIPTLELMSVYLALRCVPSLINSLSGLVTSITVCVDAQIVLSWVLTEQVKTKNLCARNKVKDITKFRHEILRDFGIECKFKYLPTELNPADLLTRGLSSRDYEQKKSFWLNGPEFFLSDKIQWPVNSLGCLSEDSKILTLCTNVKSKLETIFPVDKYSSLNKLLKVTALVIKFVNLRTKIERTMLQNFNDARIYWFKCEQAKYYSNEIFFLTNPEKKNVPNLVKNLNLFLDSNGLVRTRGRLTRCLSVSEEVNNPILLPRESYLTTLIIEDVHRECKHLGVGTTLISVRKRGYWVPKGRVVVKTVLASCVVCKKINNHSFKYPKPNDYVFDKVNFVNAYQHVGIDYTGHVYVKLGDKLSKMFLLVFTCLNVRAVHIELLPDMTCNNFLLAFVRFCNQFRIPSAVYSDNASTFLQALGIISESTVDNEFCEYLIRNNIRHVKIPLYAAWIGSAWERMIRTIKSSINKVVGRKHMAYFQLVTFLSDLENCINSRPLTYLSNDLDIQCITPNSFLKSETGNCLQLDGVAGQELVVPSRRELVRSLQMREDMLQKAKDIWVEEYLLSLRESGRDLYQTEWTEQIKVGDVILISSPIKARPLWQMGKVTELLPGTDKIVRTVRVKRPDRSEGIYPINLLYPLELSVASMIDCENDNSDCRGSATNIRSVPKRAAALKCAEKLKHSN